MSAVDDPACENYPQVRLPSRVGEVLSDKYRILRKLGEGGMGAVYEAQHTFVGRRFAVKFLHRELANDQEMLVRFRREAQTAGSLENENIAAVMDFGFATDGAPYLVMEHLEGEDFRSLLNREGQLPVQRIINIIIQGCRGLDAAHERDIVHRDLKPENLFITRRGDGTDLVKILDFGIAKLRNPYASGISTRGGTMMGTLHYMPIEQVRGDKNIDQRADIYALGAILYEGLSGALPHPGDKPHLIIYHIMHDPVAPLDSLRMRLPEGLSEVVHKALAHEFSERFQSVAELAYALEPFAGRRLTPFNSKVALPIGSGHTKTVQASVSEVQSDKGPDGPTAYGPPSENHAERSEAKQSPRADRVSSSLFTRQRILTWIGMFIIACIAAAVLLVWGIRSQHQRAEQGEPHIVRPAAEDTAPGTLSGKIVNNPSRPIVNPKPSVMTVRPLQDEKNDSRNSKAGEPPKKHAGELTDKQKAGRPAKLSGRPDGHRSKHLSVRNTPSGKQHASRSTAPKRDSSQRDLTENKQSMVPVSNSTMEPSQSIPKPLPSVIERHRGDHPVTFDIRSPYQ